MFVLVAAQCNIRTGVHDVKDDYLLVWRSDKTWIFTFLAAEEDI